MRKDDRRETQKCTTIILYHKSKDLRHFMYNCTVNKNTYKWICFMSRYYIYIYLNVAARDQVYAFVRVVSTAQTGANVFSILHPHFEARTINPPQSLVHASSNLSTW